MPPYLQLHEFEGLLFNNIDAFKNRLSHISNIDLGSIEKIISQNPNPELINDGKESAPSVRLKDLIKGYKKVIYGAILAREIGLTNIRAKSPRFNSWIEALENL